MAAEEDGVRNSFGDHGASLVQYALLIALISIVCVVAVGFLGASTAPGLSEIGSTLN